MCAVGSGVLGSSSGGAAAGMSGKRQRRCNAMLRCDADGNYAKHEVKRRWS